MIKEALQYIVGLGKVEKIEVNNRNYTSEKLHPVYEPIAPTLEVTTLSAIIDYIKSGIDGEMALPVLIHIESPTSVRLYSPLSGDFQQRECYMKASPLLPNISFGKWDDSESFIIALQSKYVKNQEAEILFRVAGNIRSEKVQSVGDDGISQAVTIKTGVTKVGDVLVPNPVILAPYRTFPEIEQPESSFIFRMKEGPYMALFEADGGAWRIEAMKNIDEYLEANLVGCNVQIIC